jgi:ABC-2 type transport system ATP-binding protein
MIEAVGLTKIYGNKIAVSNVSFKTKETGVTGFLGPNGAGKSTTMNLLTNCIRPNAGVALVNEISLAEKPLQAKRNLGYLPENPPLYAEMTVEEYLNFVYALKGVKQRDLPRFAHLKELTELTQTADVMKRVIRNLSRGYKQRVGLAAALVGNPRVIILDEPTAGLDPAQIIETRELIKKLGENHAVILSSHILSEISAVCDKILIINKGKIALNTSIDNIVTEENKLMLQIEGSPDKVTGVLKKFGEVSVTKAEHYEVVTDTDKRKEIGRALSESKLPVLEMKKNETALEETYLKIVSEE